MKETKSIKLPKKLLAMIEDADFSVKVYENEFEFGKYSTEGQDFSFSIFIEPEDTLESINFKIREYYEGYDVSEETALWIDDTGHGKNGAPYELEDILDDMKECKSFILELSQIFEMFINSKRGLKRLNIKMAYTFVGDTYIDVPAGLTIEEAVEYARKHLSEIPVAENAKYIPDSDNFELEDCSF